MSIENKFKGKGRPKGKNKILPAHREIFKNYKEQGFRHLGKAIRKTGVYSETVASRVNKITSTKSWQAIMAEYMPEEHLALRHSELLDKRDTETIYDETKNADGSITKVARLVDTGPETNAVSKGLELAYRLRGSFSKEEGPVSPANVYNLFYKPEVREQVAVFEAGIKQSLYNEINKKNLRDIREEEERNADSGGGGESLPDIEENDAGGEGGDNDKTSIT